MVWLLIVYALLVAIPLLGIGVVGLRFKGTLTKEPLPDEIPQISTIVPARNEERNIGRCAQGLMRQDYPRLEMVFVDDASTDATPDILTEYARRDGRVKVIQTGGKPDDWNGKQWACHSGSAAASGDWLCFMDADTYAEPHLVSRTIAFALAHNIDMLTLQPWYEMCGLWERIVLPAGLMPLLLVFPPARVNDPHTDLAMANGQFILIRREAYSAINGHEGIKDRMMDDFSLAENLKGAGYRLFVAEGMDVMSVRLYTNLGEIWSGALKAAVEISGGWVSSLISLFLNLLVNVLPVALLIWAVAGGERFAILVLGALVCFQLCYYAVLRMAAFRVPPWSSVTYPVGGIIVTAILLDGMIRVASGAEIKWKDRPVMGRPGLPTRK